MYIQSERGGSVVSHLHCRTSHYNATEIDHDEDIHNDYGNQPCQTVVVRDLQEGIMHITSLLERAWNFLGQESRGAISFAEYGVLPDIRPSGIPEIGAAGESTRIALLGIALQDFPQRCKCDCEHKDDSETEACRERQSRPFQKKEEHHK